MDQHQTHAISQICRRTASFSPFRERGGTITRRPRQGQIVSPVAFRTLTICKIHEKRKALKPLNYKGFRARTPSGKDIGLLDFDRSQVPLAFSEQ